MPIISRVKDFFTRSRPAPDDDFWYSPAVGGYGSSSGVDEKTAMNFLSVAACVTLISADVAKLPLNLYKTRKDGGKDRITNHRLYDLMHFAPNEETAAFNFRETAQGQLLLWGNSFAEIIRDKKGSVSALWQISDPSTIEVVRKNGHILYKYNVNSRSVVKSREEMFHLPGFGYNGLVGLSMISLAREGISLGLSAESFGLRYFTENTNISGTIEMDGYLGNNKKEFMRAMDAAYKGLGKSHGVMMLEGGAKFKKLTQSLEDSQFLATRTFQRSEIAAIYHVPEHKIGNFGQNSNHNSLEAENGAYVDQCLLPWLIRWESQIGLQLLTAAERRAGLFFQFNVAGLLRGDSTARADYYNKLFQIGVMSPNEIRAKENLNPVANGEQHYVMLNMVPLGEKREEPEVDTEEKEPEQKPDIKEVKAFFNKDLEQRSITARDRIAKNYKPLILDAAQAVVNRETKAIQKELSKASRGDGGQAGFLEEFYKNFPAYVELKMAPVLRSFMMAITDETREEIAAGKFDTDADIKAYIDRYVARHVGDSSGQLTALLREEDPTAAIQARTEEWQEKRAGKIAMNETTRASGAAFSFVVFGAGLRLVWRIRGKETCPYCRSLNGKIISKGEYFVKDGEELKPEGVEKPMKIRGSKAHAPAHDGCDCYTTAVA